MQKPTIKISKELKKELDNLSTKKDESYEQIIKGLLKWKWYKQRNKILEQNFHEQDKREDEYLKEIADLQKKIRENNLLIRGKKI